MRRDWRGIFAPHFTVDFSGYECSRGNHYSHFHRTLLTATNPVRDFTDAAMSFVAES
jgi:hypothetical protein